MTRREIVSNATWREFWLAYHVLYAGFAVADRGRGWNDTARIYARIARSWLDLYVKTEKYP